MQQGYRPYPGQMPQRSPHVQNPRRQPGVGPIMVQPPIGSHHQVAMTPQQLQQQAQAQAHATEQAKRRSSRPTDKTMPDGVEGVVIGDGVQRYRDLRDLERRLDATMTRKRLDVVDSVTRNPKRYKTLRIWISNTVEDQPWQGNGLNVNSFDFSSTVESSYRVKIEGRLLGEDDDADQEEDETAREADGGDDKMDTDAAAKAKAAAKPASAKPGQRYRFSHFFKSLSVEFSDRNRARNGAEQTVEWKKPDRTPAAANLPAAADFDELTFKRSGDENTGVIINLQRHEEPDRFALSPALSEIVDMQEGTRPEIVQGLYEYIKLMGLQEDEEKRNFRCDDLLRQVVGKETGWIPDLQAYITHHLRPLPPVQLPYTIRVDEEFHKDPQPTIYDVRVAVDDPIKARLLPFMQDPQYASILKEVAGLDDKLATLIQGIAASKAKHSFFDNASRDPVTFIRTWLSSQKRDLEVIMGEAPRGGGEQATGDEWRRGGRNGVWSTDEAKESVNYHLAKLLQQQHLQAQQPR